MFINLNGGDKTKSMSIKSERIENKKNNKNKNNNETNNNKHESFKEDDSDHSFFEHIYNNTLDKVLMATNSVKSIRDNNTLYGRSNHNTYPSNKRILPVYTGSKHLNPQQSATICHNVLPSNPESYVDTQETDYSKCVADLTSKPPHSKTSFQCRPHLHHNRSRYRPYYNYDSNVNNISDCYSDHESPFNLTNKQLEHRLILLHKIKELKDKSPFNKKVEEVVEKKLSEEKTPANRQHATSQTVFHLNNNNFPESVSHANSDHENHSETSKKTVKSTKKRMSKVSGKLKSRKKTLSTFSRNHSYDSSSSYSNKTTYGRKKSSMKQRKPQRTSHNRKKSFITSNMSGRSQRSRKYSTSKRNSYKDKTKRRDTKQSDFSTYGYQGSQKNNKNKSTKKKKRCCKMCCLEPDCCAGCCNPVNCCDLTQQSCTPCCTFGCKQGCCQSHFVVDGSEGYKNSCGDDDDLKKLSKHLMSARNKLCKVEEGLMGLSGQRR